MKEVKVRSKSKDFYLSIINLLKEGKRPSQIARGLNISKQRLQFYIKNLKDKGIISKKGYGTWEVKEEVKVIFVGDESDSFTSPTTNLHALQINIPILSGEIKGSDWQIGEKLNNWLPKYKKLTILGGITLKNNNNKSITIFANSRDIKKLGEIDKLTFKILKYAEYFFKVKYDVLLDITDAEVKNLNIATEDKHSKEMIRKGEKFELNLNKKAEKILPKDKINAKAWIDGSPFKFSAETNDKEWKRAYLQMPFTMQNTMTAVNYIAQNYASHVKMVEEGSKIFTKLNKTLDKIQGQKTTITKHQTNLKQWD